MASVLTSFLIGIGLDTTEFTRGQQNVTSGLDTIKARALLLGSVVAGAFGMAKLGGDFAEATDRLGKFGQTFGLAADDVAGFGRAIQANGGEFESAMSQLEQIEKWRAAFKIGDTSWFKAAGIAGVDYNAIITSSDALQALLAQADKFKAASPQMRINMMNVLGIDPATLRLLSQGREGAADLIGKYKAMRPVTEEATKASADYNRELLNLKTNMGALTDQLAMKVLPLLNTLLDIANSTPEVAVKKITKEFLTDESGKAVMGQRAAPIDPKVLAAGRKKGDNGAFPLAKGYNWIAESMGWSKINLDAGDGPAFIQPSMPTGPAVMPQPAATRQSAQTEALQKAQANTSANQQPIIVHTHLNLDGREIDNRIVEVSQRGHKATLDDVKSTTSR
ncbi:gp55 putative tail-fiber/lysozyme protein [Iodobacter phage PhiPLPE]|uniref:Gp55 putative tail-fiber/lysozyme protein n=1 Tax=Iodobacter phage PhiPLPE TaxID=551895 RepID=B5AX74_9CAUD|nr:tail fiber protein/ lysozyme [Iodobacter phage PhiPLPE]ACG60377.1 gp55 putative tail-fiber/lysozyme protein [Iodobacter phage PhiPLPE]